jgi:hypothetical protein
VSFAFEGNAYNKYPEQLGAITLRPDFQLDLSPLDSDIDLVWQNDSGFIGYDAFRFGIGVDGSQLISQGYRFIGALTNPALYGSQGGSTPFSVAVAIRPTASAWEANETQNLTQRCGKGQVSWNAQVILFSNVPEARHLAGWNSGGAYFTIPCHSYTCGEGPPSFSMTKSVLMSVDTTPFNFGSQTYFTGSITLESA